MNDWYPLIMLAILTGLLVWSTLYPPPPDAGGDEDCFGPLS
jgi:hypothetical protein